MKILRPKHENNIKNYLRDLVRNEHFLRLADLKVEIHNNNLPKSREITEILGKLLKNEEERRVLIGELRSRTGDFYSMEDIVDREMAIKYGVDSRIFYTLLVEINEDLKIKLIKDYPEWAERRDGLSGPANTIGNSCRIDHDDSLLKRSFSPEDVESNLPYELEKNDLLEKLAYPLSIRLHRTASHNEVITFIDDNWKVIEQYLEGARKNKTKLRNSKRDQAIKDIIYDNRDKALQEIKDILNETLPKNLITKPDIAKIKIQETEKRNSDISLI